MQSRPIIIFFGTSDFVIPVAEALYKNFILAAVVTSPDQPAGRNHVLTPPPMKVWANTHKLPVLQPEQPDNEAMQQLSSLLPDLFVIASYGKIIPQSLIDIPTYGALNIHPSRLPQFRGATPIPSTIMAGQTESCVTIIKMDDKMDHGPILELLPFSIGLDETSYDLLHRTFILAAQHLPTIIQHYISGSLLPHEQEHEKATYCKKITKQDGYIDLENPPHIGLFDRMIRAYYPWPGVWTKLQMANGTWQIVKFYPGKKIQIEGRKPVDSETFYRGYPELKKKIEKLYV